MKIRTTKSSIAVLWCAAILIGSGMLPLRANEEPTPSKPATRAEVQQLIEKLDSDSFQQREMAMRRLIEIGEPAIEPLDEATRSKSYEVRTRAAAVLRTLQTLPLRAAFLEFAKSPDEKLDVEQGMWLISRILNPKVRREDLQRPLDEMAAQTRRVLGKDVDPRTAPPSKVVEALRSVIFEENKFAGNTADYANPDNSSLEKVLATRKGLPITLSHVVIAVANRLNVPIVGLPTPGRYIVAYDAQRAPKGTKMEPIYFDPFNGGKILTEDDFRLLFPATPVKDLTPSSNRDVLVRMMNNLERHLFDRNQPEKGYQVLEFRQILMGGG